ncbi:MAG: type III PLP-dependent enzyme [Alphaproteobacteria bacterium]|nr:type III PLP-dependent enzyme [Alphaproteobacteria bacterium]
MRDSLRDSPHFSDPVFEAWCAHDADSHDRAVIRAMTRRRETPVHLVYGDVLKDAAARAVSAFPGDVLYAVKCNDHPMVLRALYDGGVRHFDVASIREVELIRGLFPDSTCHYMHPVKPGFAIEEAHHMHGVTAFALDDLDELDKIDAALGEDADKGAVMLAVRVEMPRGQAAMDLTGKFGAPVQKAAAILAEVAARGYQTGLTFHVGSYCTNPRAYVTALEICRRVQRLARVPLDVIDAGGGFPASYTGNEGPFAAYVTAITETVSRLNFLGRDGRAPVLRCEPGRGLVGLGQSILTKVDLRRGGDLFLNDGVFGGLSELKYLGPYFPIQALRPTSVGFEPITGGGSADFQLFGPTCDSVDSCPGPFRLPDAVRTGDWLEIGKMGAYSNAYRTEFNGFHSDLYSAVSGQPFWAKSSSADASRRAA